MRRLTLTAIIFGGTVASIWNGCGMIRSIVRNATTKSKPRSADPIGNGRSAMPSFRIAIPARSTYARRRIG